MYQFTHKNIHIYKYTTIAFWNSEVTCSFGQSTREKYFFPIIHESQFVFPYQTQNTAPILNIYTNLFSFETLYIIIDKSI